MLYWLCLVLLCGAYVVRADTSCPDAWIPYKGSCYNFYDEVRLSWYASVEFCKRHHDSDLAIVESSNENIFLQSFARKLIDVCGARNFTAFWLGASDLDIEGIWKWLATDEELVFTDWNSSRNEPDRTPDNHSDCLALNGAYNFGWVDGSCNMAIGHPLCEKRNSETTKGEYIVG